MQLLKRHTQRIRLLRRKRRQKTPLRDRGQRDYTGKEVRLEDCADLFLPKQGGTRPAGCPA